MNTTTQLTITIGAAARLTRLVTRDTITEPLRTRLLYDREQRAALTVGEMAPPPKRPSVARARAWAYGLATCDWCAGMWVSAAVVGLASAATHRDQQRPARWFTIPAAALTVSHAVGYLASHEGE